MALGVAKTFRKCYFKSLAQALQFQKGLNKTEATQLAKTIQNEIGTDITMGTTDAFGSALKRYFSDKSTLAITAVSYTHLDVYKRQPTIGFVGAPVFVT